MSVSAREQHFGTRIRPWSGDLKPEVHLGGVSQDMVRASQNGWFENPDDTFYMGYGTGEEGALQAKATWVHALENERSIRPMGIYVEGKPVGYILFRPEPARKIMGVTLWVHPESRRDGIGTTSMARICGHLFARGVYRVESEILRCDRRAEGFLKNFGMKREGYRIRSVWMGGKPFDTTVYRVLRPDWEAREDDSYWRETN